VRPQLEERVAYGRAVRERALCLIEAHGARAIEVLHDAVGEAGLPIGERLFLEAVSARLDRLARAPRGRLGNRSRRPQPFRI
jgi:hypothetical protein